MKENLRTLNFDRVSPLLGSDAEPAGIHAVVETPRGNRNKFAYDPKFGLIVLKQTLAAHLEWPCDFGFVPQTLGDDGDALDVCLVLDVTTFPTCLVRSRVLGTIGMKKDGVRNDRIVVASVPMPGTKLSTDGARALGDIAERVDAIERFLVQYPEDEGDRIELTRRYDPDETMTMIRKAHKRWTKAS